MSTLAINKKALRDYEVLERLEAGLILSGPEVKSAKAGQINLGGGFVKVNASGVWLVNIQLAPYPPAASVQREYNPARARQLLLHRREIDRLTSLLQQKGLTSIPLKIYTKNNLVKCEIAIVRGKKKYEKREQIKKKEIKRRLRQALKT